MKTGEAESERKRLSGINFKVNGLRRRKEERE